MTIISSNFPKYLETPPFLQKSNFRLKNWSLCVLNSRGKFCFIWGCQRRVLFKPSLKNPDWKGTMKGQIHRPPQQLLCPCDKLFHFLQAFKNPNVAGKEEISRSNLNQNDCLDFLSSLLVFSLWIQLLVCHFS